MALILCHSPKGGVGTSFLAANLAILLAARGHDVAALDFTWQSALKLFFGLPPSQPLPDMDSLSREAVVVSGVELFSAFALAQAPGFHDRLRQGGPSPFDGGKIYVADVAADDRATRDLLLPHAGVHVCALHPRPDSLAALPKVQAGTPAIDLPKTVFVLNHLDNTQRLSRHSYIFLRELLAGQLIGTVHRDEAVNEALGMFVPLARFAPTSLALADLRKLAEALARRIGIDDIPDAQR